MDTEITVKIIAMAAEQVGLSPAEVTLESHFLNDLGYDSLDVVEFGMNVEEEFELSVPDEDLETLQTVGQVADYVRARVNAGNGTAQQPPIPTVQKA